MNAPPYQKLFWGSYHKHTAHLSHAREHGAYLLLIGALWNNEGRLPADDDTLAGYAKLSTEEWVAMKPKLMRLFKVVRGKLTQPRVTDDLAKYRDTSGKRKQAGKAGGIASVGKRTENPEANASVLPTKPEPEPEPKEEPPVVPPRGTKSPKISKDQVQAVWSACPVVARQRSSVADVEGALNAALRRGHTPEAVLVGLLAAYRSETYAGDKAKGVHRLIDKDRWASFVETTGPAHSTGPASTFDGPPALRAALVKERDEDYARRWLDHYCRWRPEDRTLLARTGAVAATLNRDLVAWLAKHDIRVAVDAANTNTKPDLFEQGTAA